MSTARRRRKSKLRWQTFLPEAIDADEIRDKVSDFYATVALGLKLAANGHSHPALADDPYTEAVYFAITAFEHGAYTQGRLDEVRRRIQPAIDLQAELAASEMPTWAMSIIKRDAGRRNDDWIVQRVQGEARERQELTPLDSHIRREIRAELALQGVVRGPGRPAKGVSP